MEAEDWYAMAVRMDLERFKQILSDNNLDPETLSLSQKIAHHSFRISDHKGDCVSDYPFEYKVFIEKGAVYYEILIKMYATYDYSVYIGRHIGVWSLDPLECDQSQSVASNICIRSKDRLFSTIQDHFPYPLYIF